MQITPFTSLSPISLINRILFALLLLCSLPVAADTTLHLDEDILLVAENGKVINRDHRLYRKNPIVLNDGVNQLLVRFNAELEEEDGETRYRRTEAFVLVFDTAENNHQSLRLRAPQIGSEEQLEDFNKDPYWLLTGEANKNISLKVAALIKDGVQFGRDFERELEKFNETQSVAALSYLTRGPLIGAANARFAPAPVEADATVVQRASQYRVTKEQNTPAVSIDWLLYLYKQAPKNVQEQFKRIITQ